ncbi:MAG: iduronate 2-sulfatase [Cyclobacteriaceae bacterium]|jgi:iduronate 2-sulfatase
MKLSSTLRFSILILVLLLNTFCVFSQATLEKPKMNVLFISVDDLRAELNCYGKSAMKTPNIDQLANEGLAFKRAYCQQAICMASRASILTGIRPENKKLYTCDALVDLAPDVLTINKHFANNGYNIEAIGKTYHHQSDHIAQFGEKWSDPTNQHSPNGYVSDEAISKLQANAKFNPNKKRGPAYEMADVPDNYYIDGANTDYAISKLKKLKKQDKPFFMALGFHRPHLPFCAPKKYWDMYPVEEISLSPAPEYPTNITPYSLTNWGEMRSYFGIPKGTDQVSDELALQLRRGYYASVSYADAQLGRVMAALEKYGLKENTIIVLWGDHGYKLGDHHAWSKHTNFEIDAQVPLIISVPNMKTSDKQTYSFAELVDLYPTLCDLVGIDQPEHLEGESLVPILENPSKQIKDAAYSIFPRNRTVEQKTITGFSIRTEAFRYTEWIHISTGRRLTSELYDHQVDSLENHNVVSEKAHAASVKMLSRKLHNKFDESIPGLKAQPDVFLYNRADLLYAKKLYQLKKEPFVTLVNDLKSEANELLEVKPYSVMQKTMASPSKNMHDYYSLGPYWWPNPDTKDGLPYVRHDGKVNPAYDNYDGVAIGKMSQAVFRLSLAYFYTTHEPYAQKANELLQTWFFDPATKMNPHLEYGQAIPGITEGRGIGIIETGCMIKVVEAVGLLKNSKSFSNSDSNRLKNWFLAYNNWLVTSQIGCDERMWHNNHGSSYDSQVAEFSRFAGMDSIASMILDSMIIKRINRQIEPDGSQPWELERTKSMHYSIKNLSHLMENAILADHYDIDIWNYESVDGRSIKQAIKFLIPYMLGEKEWSYTQYGGIESSMEGFKELIWTANQYLDDEDIKRAFNQLCTRSGQPLAINLLYPFFDLEIEMNPR